MTVAALALLGIVSCKKKEIYDNPCNCGEVINTINSVRIGDTRVNTVTVVNDCNNSEDIFKVVGTKDKYLYIGDVLCDNGQVTVKKQ